MEKAAGPAAFFMSINPLYLQMLDPVILIAIIDEYGHDEHFTARSQGSQCVLLVGTSGLMGISNERGVEARKHDLRIWRA